MLSRHVSAGIDRSYVLVQIGFNRRILLFPFGNSNGQPNDMVSVYLDYADNGKEDGWHVCAQFALVISNPQDPRIYSTSRE